MGLLSAVPAAEREMTEPDATEPAPPAPPPMLNGPGLRVLPPTLLAGPRDDAPAPSNEPKRLDILSVRR
jgi:hypothetical protein